nr:shikimate kinase [Kibdelosporangium sp. MJ126-NF4]CEL22737.1 Shikimate kinase I \
MSSKGPVLVLVGPPGSGKSTIGRLAAERLGVGFRDFDDDMAAEHGKEAGDLVVDFGRERFQELEHELLVRVLPQHDGVLALGGGTPTAPGVPDLLEPFHVVFLDVDLDHLLRREGLVALHPWLMPNPRAHLRQMLTDRRPVYTRVANATVETNGREPMDILEDVLAAMPVR